MDQHRWLRNCLILVSTFPVATLSEIGECTLPADQLQPPNLPDGGEQLTQLRAELQALHNRVALLESKHITDASSHEAPPNDFSNGPVATLYQRRQAWSDYFELTSAWRLNDDASAVCFVATRQPDVAKYLVVGGTTGRLYFLHPAGRLLWQHDTGGGAAVTALTSYRVGSNVSVVVAATTDGIVHQLNVTDTWGRKQQLPQDRSIVQVASASSWPAWLPASAQGAGTNLLQLSASRSGPYHYITALARGAQQDWLASWHANGTLRAAEPSKHRVHALHAHGGSAAAVSANGTLMLAPRNAEVDGRLRVYGCEGLPEAGIVAACINSAGGTQVHAVTHHGALLMLAARNERVLSHCKVRHSQPLPLLLPTAATCMRGLLLLSSQQGAALYNASGKGAPVLLHVAGRGDMMAAGKLQVHAPEGADKPIATAALGPLLALHYGGGVMALYKVRPEAQPPLPPSHNNWLAGKPLLLIGMVVMIVWRVGKSVMGSAPSLGRENDIRRLLRATEQRRRGPAPPVRRGYDDDDAFDDLVGQWHGKATAAQDTQPLLGRQAGGEPRIRSTRRRPMVGDSDLQRWAYG